MATAAKNSNHTWIPATLNGGVSMDGINLDENDVKDPDLMTAIPQEMDLPATFLHRATTLKFRAHLAFFLTNTQSNLYPNLVFEREFRAEQMNKGWSMKLSVDAYSRFIVNNPILVIVLSLIWAGLAIYGVTNFRFTNDYRYFFSSENPYLTAFEELERTYASPDTLLLVYQPKDGTKATSAQALQMVEEITTRGWQIPFSTRVDSITNFQNTRAIGEDDLEVRDLVVNAGQTDAEMRAYVEETILNEPLLVGRLLSEDARTGAILISLRPPRDDPAATNSIVSAARDLRAEMRDKYPNIRLELTGSQMIGQSFNEASEADLSTLFPLMFALITGFLILATGTISGTIATAIVITLSAATAMGFGFWLSIPLSAPAASAPVIILTVAVADCVHILITAIVARGQGIDKKEAIIESLSVNAQPVFLTSVTTAIGLFSLNFSDAPPYRDLGSFAGFGAIFAWILSMSLFPALLTLMPMRKTRSVNRQSLIMSKFRGLGHTTPAAFASCHAWRHSHQHSTFASI